MFKDHQADLTAQDKKLMTARHEVNVMNVKLKEKEQEVKLNDLKMRELKRQVPNTRLKPLKGRRSSAHPMSKPQMLQEESHVIGLIKNHPLQNRFYEDTV